MSHQHIPCIKCGYDLFGVDVDAACPECGVHASRSVLATRLYVVPLKGVVKLLLPCKLWFAWNLIYTSIAVVSLFVGNAMTPLVFFLFYTLGMMLPLMLAWRFDRLERTPGSRAVVLLVAAVVVVYFLVLPRGIGTSEPWLGSLMLLPIPAMHALQILIQARIPSPKGVRISLIALAVSVMLVFQVLFTKDILQFFSMYLSSNVASFLFIGLPYLMFLASLIASLSTWRNTRRVVQYRLQHGELI